jgi:hypothetical protein
MLITEFLVKQCGYEQSTPGLAQLKELAGATLGDARFYGTVEEASRAIEPWMPIHILPIGVFSTMHVGLHLRPPDIAARRLAVLCVFSAPEMIEVASTIDDYAFWVVAQMEAGAIDEEGQLDDELKETVAKARKLFGRSFYKPGERDTFDTLDVEHFMVAERGGSLRALDVHAQHAESLRDRLKFVEQALDIDPGSLHFHAWRTEVLDQLRRGRAAAEAAAASLRCYHHTAFRTDLGEQWEAARRLLGKTPAAFDDDSKEALRIVDDSQARMDRVEALVDAGRLDQAELTLANLCYDGRDYVTFLQLFKALYEKLGWGWAAALSGLRR